MHVAIDETEKNYVDDDMFMFILNAYGRHAVGKMNKKEMIYMALFDGDTDDMYCLRDRENIRSSDENLIEQFYYGMDQDEYGSGMSFRRLLGRRHGSDSDSDSFDLNDSDDDGDDDDDSDSNSDSDGEGITEEEEEEEKVQVDESAYGFDDVSFIHRDRPERVSVILNIENGFEGIKNKDLIGEDCTNKPKMFPIRRIIVIQMN